MPLAHCEPDESRLLYILEEGKLHATFPSQSDLLLVVVLENSSVMIVEKSRLGGGINWVEISTVFRQCVVQFI